jgi:hypothetical protein
MKRVVTLSLAIAMAITTCIASSVVAPAPPATVAPAAVAVAPAPVKASDIRIPVGNTGKVVDLQELSTMKVADYEKMTGKKMSWFHRLEFKLAQKKLRHAINADGTVNDKRLEKLTRDMDGDGGFHLGGFVLGLLLGLIGVLIAYLINDDHHRNRVKWAWIGWGVWVVIFLLAII